MNTILQLESWNMGGDIKNVFMSHGHEDDNGQAALKSLVERGGLIIRDS